MKLFGEQPFEPVGNRQLAALAKEVKEAEEKYIQSVNTEQYVNHLVQNYGFKPIELLLDQVHRTQYDRDVPAEEFPGNYNVERGHRYSKPVVQIHVPYKGDMDLLKYRSFVYTTGLLAYVDGSNITFEFVLFEMEHANILKTRIADRIEELKKEHRKHVEMLNIFNTNLRDTAMSLVRSRKETLQKRDDFLSELDIPIRKLDDGSGSFSIPMVMKRVVVKPESPSAQLPKEPTISLSDYQEFLRVIEQTGEHIERHTSIYRGKKEEDLRDLFLMVFQLGYESATGEAFNKVGKTDILIRHEGKVAFIAECKVWDGKKVFLDAISQTLSYLTWRDSKTALLMFVHSRGFENVLNQIEGNAKEHLCFVRQVGQRVENRFDFEFHLPDDESRNCRMAIRCFHFPSS